MCLLLPTVAPIASPALSTASSNLIPAPVLFFRGLDMCASIAHEMPIHRVNVNFSEGAFTDLSNLAEERGKTKAEILRDAIALERWFHEERRSGGRVLVERVGGELREVIPR